MDKNNNMIVLAWNFYKDIKNNNKDLSNNFVNIKDLENQIIFSNNSQPVK